MEKKSPGTAKKMNMLLVICMGIGSIIGAGIFTTTPIAITMVGKSLVWVFIVAAIYVCLRMLPSLMMSSALPANGGDYMHTSRMLPYPCAILLTLKNIVHGTMNIAVLSLTCGQYVNMLFPAVSETVAAVACALIFAVIGTFGARISGIAQAICVAVLLIALGVFIFGGFPHIQPANITLEQVMSNTFQLGTVYACLGLLNSTLMGGNSVIAFAEEVENPGRDIPLAFIIATMGTSVIYALFTYVAIGVGGVENIHPGPGGSIGDVAATFLSPAWLTFFITGGALLAVATTLNGTLMMVGFQDMASARDYILPSALGKMNRYNAPYGGIWFTTVIAVIAIIIPALDLPTILAAGTCSTMFLGQLGIFPLFVVKRYYPLSYKNCFMSKIPHWLNLILAIGTTYLSFEYGAELFRGLNSLQLWILGVALIGGYIIIELRAVWLKKTKGIDMHAKIREPYQPWVEREEELRQQAASKVK